jgi:hypothetical protein
MKMEWRRDDERAAADAARRRTKGEEQSVTGCMLALG